MSDDVSIGTTTTTLLHLPTYRPTTDRQMRLPPRLVVWLAAGMELTSHPLSHCHPRTVATVRLTEGGRRWVVFRCSKEGMER